jgi:hypothetical protein
MERYGQHTRHDLGELARVLRDHQRMGTGVAFGDKLEQTKKALEPVHLPDRPQVAEH